MSEFTQPQRVRRSQDGTKSRSRGRSTCLTLFILGLLLGACLAALAVVLAIWLPGQAGQAFGPARPGLAASQRLYLAARLWLASEALQKPLDPLGQPRPFRVESGESTYAITNRLQSEALIRDGQALRDYLVYAGLDTSLQAGEFSLSPAMSALEIAHALQDATPSEVTFGVLPGWRMEEIAAALPTSGLTFTAEEFLDAARQPPAVFSLTYQLPGDASLEGFFFADSYRVPRQASAREFVETLLDNFRIKASREILEGFQRQGLTPFQAVTLASIVQREAVVEEEMPVIASVFLNRLAAGMKLDTDPSVQYALGYQTEPPGWWKSPLDLEDLQVVSSYNTYLNPGLPPGPIANPGLSALKAVAFPAQTPYYYFRAACDGSGRHAFATTFEEHQANACP